MCSCSKCWPSEGNHCTRTNLLGLNSVQAGEDALLGGSKTSGSLAFGVVIVVPFNPLRVSHFQQGIRERTAQFSRHGFRTIRLSGLSGDSQVRPHMATQCSYPSRVPTGNVAQKWLPFATLRVRQNPSLQSSPGASNRLRAVVGFGKTRPRPLGHGEALSKSHSVQEVLRQRR